MDDVFVVLESIVGSSSGKINVQANCGSKNFGNYSATVLKTSAETRVFSYIRDGAFSLRFLMGGASAGYQVYYRNNMNKTDKINNIKIITDQTFVSGKVKVYGRKKIDE